MLKSSGHTIFITPKFSTSWCIWTKSGHTHLTARSYFSRILLVPYCFRSLPTATIGGIRSSNAGNLSLSDGTPIHSQLKADQMEIWLPWGNPHLINVRYLSLDSVIMLVCMWYIIPQLTCIIMLHNTNDEYTHIHYSWGSIVNQLWIVFLWPKYLFRLPSLNSR